MVGNHPNLVLPRAALVAGEMGSPAMYLVHEYHPGAATVEATHFQPTATAGGTFVCPL